MFVAAELAESSIKVMNTKCGQLIINIFLNLCDPHRLGHARLLCPLHFPIENTGWSLPFPSPRDLPDPGLHATSLHCQADSLPLSHRGSPYSLGYFILNSTWLRTRGKHLVWKFICASCSWKDHPGMVESPSSSEVCGRYLGNPYSRLYKYILQYCSFYFLCSFLPLRTI